MELQRSTAAAFLKNFPIQMSFVNGRVDAPPPPPLAPAGLRTLADAWQMMLAFEHA